MVKQQYLPSHARRVICFLLLMAASAEELQHSESICSLDGLGVNVEIWILGGEREISPQQLLLEKRRKPKSNLFENLTLNIERPKGWSSWKNRWEIHSGESVDTHGCPDREVKHTTVKLDWLITTPDFNSPKCRSFKHPVLNASIQKGQEWRSLSEKKQKHL